MGGNLSLWKRPKLQSRMLATRLRKTVEGALFVELSAVKWHEEDA